MEFLHWWRLLLFQSHWRLPIAKNTSSAHGELQEEAGLICLSPYLQSNGSGSSSTLSFLSVTFHFSPYSFTFTSIFLYYCILSKYKTHSFFKWMIITVGNKISSTLLFWEVVVSIGCIDVSNFHIILFCKSLCRSHKTKKMMASMKVQKSLWNLPFPSWGFCVCVCVACF